MTEWRALDWLPDYEVSEDGQVRRTVTVRQFRHGRDYRRISANIGGKYKTLYVHRLVCEAFHGPQPDDRPQVAHGDGNPANNIRANLRWATPKENGEDRVLHARIPRGEDIAHAKLTWDTVRKIRREYTGARGEQRRLAERYNVSFAAVNLLLRNKTWREVDDAPPCGSVAMTPANRPPP